jgi:ornithine cyclodeaminase/alanine dehydrogenase-like protein (mu-crystallin family)
MAKLDLEYSLPKIKSNFMGDEVDLITSDPESAKAYAAKKEERLAAANAAAAAAAAAAAPAPAPASTFSLFGSGSSAPAHGAVVNPHVTLVSRHCHCMRVLRTFLTSNTCLFVNNLRSNAAWRRRRRT